MTQLQALISVLPEWCDRASLQQALRKLNEQELQLLEQAIAALSKNQPVVMHGELGNQ